MGKAVKEESDQKDNRATPHSMNDECVLGFAAIDARAKRQRQRHTDDKQEEWKD